LEAFGITADELNAVITRNNQLVAAGDIQTDKGSFAVKIPSSFQTPSDVENLPIKINGDRVITVGDIGEVRLTFEDRTGYARYNGELTLGLQIVKRRGTNEIDTADLVKAETRKFMETLPEELRKSVTADFVQDSSFYTQGMISRLEGAVLTAVALVMIVILASLGFRSALLVGFAIPSSFLLCSIFLAVLGISISNIVMFGLILSVGMLVDSAIVVVELGDKKIREGVGPMNAYTSAAKRMFWPIISSTATTLCAFLPMLFWPGMAGQFMGTLPITLIFVLSASMVVALIFLPVVGGLAGRISVKFNQLTDLLRNLNFYLRIFLTCIAIVLVVFSGTSLVTTTLSFMDKSDASLITLFLNGLGFCLSVMLMSILMGSVFRKKAPVYNPARSSRTIVGVIIKLIVGNPIMPIVVIVGILAFVVATFMSYSKNNYGVNFFVDAEPDMIGINVLARGNLSLNEKDFLVTSVEEEIMDTEGIGSIFSFSGDAGLRDTDQDPVDSVGEIQIEFNPWEERQSMGESVQDSRLIIEKLEEIMLQIPGIRTNTNLVAQGPSQGKPLNLRIKSSSWEDLLEKTEIVKSKFEETQALIFVEDTRPLPGIDWQIDIDLDKAARFGADVASVGSMIRMATSGVVLDTIRMDNLNDEIDIRVRFPEEFRTLTTLETLRVRTVNGLIPVSNFLTFEPVQQLDQVQRHDGDRFITISAGLTPDLVNEFGEAITPTERVAYLDKWLEETFGSDPSFSWEWTGDQAEQDESQTFLLFAFIGALGLMFGVLLAQFNSFYNSILVLFAVVLSITGVLIGMQVMNQPFSIIMTGTGIVSLAGIVVNHNIVLIDTYNEYSSYMPRIEAIIRTVEARIRPVFLTTITTMAGLTPMMLGISFDFTNGGYLIDSPNSIWWKPLATAVVFGLGTSVLLTLAFTPAMLAIRIWLAKGAYASSNSLTALVLGPNSRISLDRKLRIAAGALPQINIDWDQFQQVLLPLPQDNKAIEPTPGEIIEGETGSVDEFDVEPEDTQPN
ncbi:MAG: efflux RND transporter permease subunit, partial [Rhodobacteraceae bacterium]|nr:efflux RND transporter permease subunit [Paracoccaceae bacterium]